MFCTILRFSQVEKWLSQLDHAKLGRTWEKHGENMRKRLQSRRRGVVRPRHPSVRGFGTVDAKGHVVSKVLLGN